MCEVNCRLNGKRTKGLWDTGAQVSVVSRNWLILNLPELLLRDISELVGGELDIQAENKGNMQIDGWVGLSFQLASGPAITVPFLVFSEEISTPSLVSI